MSSWNMHTVQAFKTVGSLNNQGVAMAHGGDCHAAAKTLRDSLSILQMASEQHNKVMEGVVGGSASYSSSSSSCSSNDDQHKAMSEMSLACQEMLGLSSARLSQIHKALPKEQRNLLQMHSVENSDVRGLYSVLEQQQHALKISASIAESSSNLFPIAMILIRESHVFNLLRKEECDVDEISFAIDIMTGMILYNYSLVCFLLASQRQSRRNTLFNVTKKTLTTAYHATSKWIAVDSDGNDGEESSMRTPRNALQASSEAFLLSMLVLSLMTFTLRATDTAAATKTEHLLHETMEHDRHYFLAGTVELEYQNSQSYAAAA